MHSNQIVLHHRIYLCERLFHSSYGRRKQGAYSGNRRLVHGAPTADVERPSQSATGSTDAILLTREKARALALEAGFTEAGLVALPHGNQERDAARFEEWLRAGRAGTMLYLTRREPGLEGEGRLLRSRVGIPFPWARSAVVCWANYNSQQPRSTEPAAAGAGWIARYAWSSKADASGARQPSDYHKVLLKRLKALEARMHEELGAFEARSFVDTGPVVERALAEAAGLGWTGKNTCLIHSRLGSFGFLAVLITSLEARDSWNASLLHPDRCGSCRRCLEACPTGALIAPYQMDATKCISYLTIEHRGEISPDMMAGMARPGAASRATGREASRPRDGSRALPGCAKAASRWRRRVCPRRTVA